MPFGYQQPVRISGAIGSSGVRMRRVANAITGAGKKGVQRELLCELFGGEYLHVRTSNWTATTQKALEVSGNGTDGFEWHIGSETKFYAISGDYFDMGWEDGALYFNYTVNKTAAATEDWGLAQRGMLGSTNTSGTAFSVAAWAAGTPRSGEWRVIFDDTDGAATHTISDVDASYGSPSVEIPPNGAIWVQHTGTATNTFRAWALYPAVAANTAPAYSPKFPITSIISNTTLGSGHYTVVANTVIRNLVVTLPPAAEQAGRIYTIKKANTDGRTVTVDGDGSEEIDGQTTLVLGSGYQTATIQSDGFRWHRLDADNVYPITAANTDINLDETHHTVICSTTTGGINVNLPAAANHLGRKYYIKKVTSDTNLVVINGNASETIDGTNSINTNTQYESYTIQSDGSNWHIL